MQLADRIAIPALIVTSIGVVATLYTVFMRRTGASESFLRCDCRTFQCIIGLIMLPDRESRETRDHPLLPTHNDIYRHSLPSRRRYIFMEETNWPQAGNEWIPLNEYGRRRLSDVVD